MFASPRMLMHSWPRTSIWYHSDLVQESFSKTLREFMATKQVSNLRTRCSHQWGPRELGLLCSNSEKRSPKSRYRWTKLWTVVGLLSFQMMIHKQDTLAGVRNCLYSIQTTAVPSSDWHTNRVWWAAAWWFELRSRHGELTIQERAKAKLDKIQEFAHRALVYSQDLFMKVYRLPLIICKCC